MPCTLCLAWFRSPCVYHHIEKSIEVYFTLLYHSAQLRSFDTKCPKVFSLKVVWNLAYPLAIQRKIAFRKSLKSFWFCCLCLTSVSIFHFNLTINYSISVSISDIENASALYNGKNKLFKQIKKQKNDVLNDLNKTEYHSVQQCMELDLPSRTLKNPKRH